MHSAYILYKQLVTKRRSIKQRYKLYRDSLVTRIFCADNLDLELVKLYKIQWFRCTQSILIVNYIYNAHHRVDDYLYQTENIDVLRFLLDNLDYTDKDVERYFRGSILYHCNHRILREYLKIFPQLCMTNIGDIIVTGLTRAKEPIKVMKILLHYHAIWGNKTNDLLMIVISHGDYNLVRKFKRYFLENDIQPDFRNIFRNFLVQKGDVKCHPLHMRIFKLLYNWYPDKNVFHDRDIIELLLSKERYDLIHWLYNKGLRLDFDTSDIVTNNDPIWFDFLTNHDVLKWLPKYCDKWQNSKIVGALLINGDIVLATKLWIQYIKDDTK